MGRSYGGFMFKFYKLINQFSKNLKTKKFKRDDDGRIVVNMTVENDDNFLSPFCENSIPVINTDVAEFIDSSVRPINPKESLTLCIRSNCIDHNEMRIYNEAIKEHYVEKYMHLKREIRYNVIMAAALAIIGILVLCFALYLDYCYDMVMWAEVIDIVAWVFLWESVDIVVLRNRDLMVDRKRCLKCIDMKIIYR